MSPDTSTENSIFRTPHFAPVPLGLFVSVGQSYSVNLPCRTRKLVSPQVYMFWLRLKNTSGGGLAKYVACIKF